jgi:hypothetical protein
MYLSIDPLLHGIYNLKFNRGIFIQQTLFLQIDLFCVHLKN